MLCILTNPYWVGKLATKRVAAGVEHRGVLKHMRAVRTVVDIGANRGQFALAARCFAPDSCIISFEPLPKPAHIFLDVFANDERVTLHQAAIGPHSSRQMMHVSARDDSSSLLPISAAQTTAFPGTEEVAAIEVTVASLDTFIQSDSLASPALLKLDVQGFEYDALRGCESMIREFSWVYCECSFIELYSGQRLAWEIIDWLAAHGFRLSGMFNPAFEGQRGVIQADFLFIREAPTINGGGKSP